MSQREHDLSQLFLRELTEEIGLILIVIRPSQHVDGSISISRNLGIVTSGNIIGSQTHSVIQKGLELDFFVAHDIGIGRATDPIFG